jgi:hypothetical protein
MSEAFSRDLSWLMDFRGLFGAKVDLVLEPRSPDPDAPRFDYGEQLPEPRTIVLHPEGDSQGEWLSHLAEALQSTDWHLCLANLVAIPPRSLDSSIESERFWDGAAFLAEALKNTPKGKLVMALSPVALLLSEQTGRFRAWLAAAHRVEGIIYMGSPAAQLLGAHPRFSMVLLIIRSGPIGGDAQQVVRMANLGESPRSDWVRIVSDVAKRGGGEVGPSVVLRNPGLDERPWTYERFSKDFQATREDAKQLGVLRPLADFTTQITVGLHRTFQAERVIQLDEAGVIPPGALFCFGGRSIGKGGTLFGPVCAVLAEGLSEDLMLRAGDVLLRSIVNLRANGSFTLAGTVTEDMLPATFDRSCIRVRWRPDVRPDVAELLVGYLNSEHAKRWFIANGVQNTLNMDTLRRLEVPDPSNELLGALGTLADAEQQYRTWANEVMDTRRSLFVTRSFAEQLPLLLGRQRTEIERLRAARDAEGLDYRIRNYYPHPIALRRELILQLDSGKPRIEAVLDCAEHLMTWLAVIALLQESLGRGPVFARLLSYCRSGALHLDWGKCVALLQAGATFTLNHPNPLALNFPNLTELAAQMTDESSAWFRAERYLREWRNKEAHLQRLPDSDLIALSDEFVEKLNCLLEAVSFIGTLPLVYVADYELNPVSSERVATFHFVQGISPVFSRAQRKVQSELPRGAVGFWNQRGEFVSALPWLTITPCPVCKRLELFVFNRYERNQATYIAMETGHPDENKLLAKNIAALIVAPA